jgi:DNA modification methylase
MHFLDDSCVDLIITSPPYNLGNHHWDMGGNGRTPRLDGVGYPTTRDDLPEPEYQANQVAALKEMYRVTSEGGSLFYNHKVRQRGNTVIHPITWLTSKENPWVLRQEVIWDRGSTHNHEPSLFWQTDERIYWLTKGRPTIPGPLKYPTIWQAFGPVPNTPHPAPFTPRLPAFILHAVGRPGITVLDPFGGSMTTCLVAYALGYKSIGVDINPDYVALAGTRGGWVP